MNPLLLVLALAPQIVPSRSEAVVVAQATRGGRLDVAALGLGDGGVAAVRSTPHPRTGAESPGETRTPGGVRVRAKSAGVKLDFPSGRELLISPDGRIHLRAGQCTLPFLHGVRLVLADGAMVTVRRGANSRVPLAGVEVTVAGRDRRIWSAGRQVTNASRVGRFVGTTLLAAGDGGMLFTVNTAGPLIGLERVLCPEEQAARSPVRRLVVAGDLLAASLKRLPDHAPRKSVQFPQVAEAAARFSRFGHLFARDTPRPPGAAGELWFPLPDSYRLKVETTGPGVLVIGLYREGAAVPGLEWTVGGSTELHFVRPGGGDQGGPRYFLRGIDLRDLVEGLLPGRQTAAQRSAVNRVVAALGGRTPHKLEVRRR